MVRNYRGDLSRTRVAASASHQGIVTAGVGRGSKNITAMTLWSWHRSHGAVIDKVVDPRAMPAVDRLARECIEGPFDLIERQRTEKPLEQHFLTVEAPAQIEPWHSLLEKNTPGTLLPDIPVFLAQGATDCTA
jgi:hypothetical protein